MLEHYSVKNFKSFKNRTDFDFKATDYSTLKDTNTKDGILKGGLFVGGNASGKTNAIEPIRFLLDALFYSNVDLEQFFCLFPDSDDMDLNYRFQIDGHPIDYRLCYWKKEASLKEQLSLDGKVMLDHDGSHARSELSDSKEFDQLPEDFVFLRDIWFNTRFRNHPILQKWFDFLRNSICVNCLTNQARVYKTNKESSLGINEYLAKNGAEPLNRFLKECGFSYHIRYDSTQEKPDRNSEYAGLYLVRDEMNLKQGIPMDDESAGNQVLMNLLPPYLYVLEHGGMLIIDEFSSGLHNDLEWLLVKYFMERSGAAQIFLVSHSTNLLSSGLFRPDQLYAVDFDENGSKILRFSDRGPRVSQNFERMYLEGMFGGVPDYRDVWEWGREDD